MPSMGAVVPNTCVPCRAGTKTGDGVRRRLARGELICDSGEMAAQHPAPRAWSELTDTEWVVMQEVLEHDADLVMVLNEWSGNTDDAPYWNRKEKYVAEVSGAAVSLLRAGLIEVWESLASGYAGPLPSEPAGHVLATPSNWWRYDPAANWDPDEDMGRYRMYENLPSEAEPFHVYALFPTERWRELECDGGERRTRPDLRSPEVRRRSAERQRVEAGWAAVIRAFDGGQRTGLRCPENEDAELLVEWRPAQPEDLDSAPSRVYRLTGTTVMTCPACGARREVRHMVRS
jgi:hypothetical protein